MTCGTYHLCRPGLQSRRFCRKASSRSTGPQSEPLVSRSGSQGLGDNPVQISAQCGSAMRLAGDRHPWSDTRIGAMRRLRLSVGGATTRTPLHPRPRLGLRPFVTRQPSGLPVCAPKPGSKRLAVHVGGILVVPETVLRCAWVAATSVR
jgi:hypothetical protein